MEAFQLHWSVRNYSSLGNIVLFILLFQYSKLLCWGDLPATMVTYKSCWWMHNGLYVATWYPSPVHLASSLACQSLGFGFRYHPHFDTNQLGFLVNTGEKQLCLSSFRQLKVAIRTTEPWKYSVKVIDESSNSTLKTALLFYCVDSDRCKCFKIIKKQSLAIIDRNHGVA